MMSAVGTSPREGFVELTDGGLAESEETEEVEARAEKLPTVGFKVRR